MLRIEKIERTDMQTDRLIDRQTAYSPSSQPSISSFKQSSIHPSLIFKKV